MHVQLKLLLSCSPDAAADALANPAVMVAVTRPLVVYRPIAPVPRRWTAAAHPVRVALLGVLPMGRTHVDLAWREVADPAAPGDDGLGGIARIQENTGRGISGVFRLLRIRHRMAVSPAPLAAGLPKGTLLRDRLEFDAGPLTPLLWPGLWLVWQWRGAQMRRLA